MELKDAIIHRRSVRRYNGTPISDADMQDILDTAIWAPSGVNLQPWYFVVCRSEASLAKLSTAMETGHAKMETYLNSRFAKNPEVVHETMNFIRTLGGADTCILAFLKDTSYADELSVIQSVAAAMQNMALLAHEKGIGTCWITAPTHAEEAIKAAFAPDKGRLLSAMTFGYSDTTPKAPPRKPGRIEIL